MQGQINEYDQAQKIPALAARKEELMRRPVK
jgi:hypothetical protein